MPDGGQGSAPWPSTISQLETSITCRFYAWKRQKSQDLTTMFIFMVSLLGENTTRSSEGLFCLVRHFIKRPLLRSLLIRPTSIQPRYKDVCGGVSGTFVRFVRRLGALLTDRFYSSPAAHPFSSERGPGAVQSARDDVTALGS
ncbi:hypothetical protein EVAR_6165_1 [Eumeta japonica]|uniref:Uncharacterized protein n=1 Tax=Eumeta variegata TaxID=151549 RepID=A0A4C1TFD5_EUMVA|nr:hypothetical protein EVAR_6165_1 [Eumeta japonica]